MKKNKMLEMPLNKQLSIGIFINIADPKMLEMAAIAGYDFIRVDTEHNLMDMTTTANLIRTANLMNIPVVVRIPVLDDVSKYIDFGADGVIIPGVKTREDAMAAVDAVKFYPLGQRGAAGTARCSWYGDIPIDEYMKVANEQVSLTLQIENKTAIENIDDILSVEGVDMVASGKNDISQALGFPGQPNHPDVIAVENFIIKKALEYGKVPTMMSGTPARVKELISMGVYSTTITTDCGLVLKALKANVKQFEELR
jgi:4-hydroxy-2-oxoheptanedioate aldolase